VLAHDVIAHRLVLTFDALADGISAEQVVDRILSTVPAPRVIWDEPPSGESASFASAR
jgi:MoxR-like ATPase